MELGAALEYFGANHRSMLATRRRDGRPQLSPVVHAVELASSASATVGSGSAGSAAGSTSSQFAGAASAGAASALVGVAGVAGAPSAAAAASAENGGRILISTRSAAAKVLNVQRDPQVSICGVSDGFFGKWVQVDGTATIISLPEAMPLLRFIYAQISGEHPDWEEYERDMVAQRRVVVAIQPEAAGPDYSG